MDPHWVSSHVNGEHSMSFVLSNRNSDGFCTNIVSVLQNQDILHICHISINTDVDCFGLHRSINAELTQNELSLLESTSLCISVSSSGINLLDSLFQSCFLWFSHRLSSRIFILLHRGRFLQGVCNFPFSHYDLSIAPNSYDHSWCVDNCQCSRSPKTSSSWHKRRIWPAKRSPSSANASVSGASQCYLHHTNSSLSGRSDMTIAMREKNIYFLLPRYTK